MEPLVFGLCMAVILGISQQTPFKKYPVRTSGSRRKLNEHFLEEKLMEQSEALDQLLKNVQKNEDLTKRLLDTLSAKLEEPKLPEVVEVKPKTTTLASGRRTFEETTIYPVEEFGNMLPKYGNLIRNWVLGSLYDEDPVALVEEK